MIGEIKGYSSDKNQIMNYCVPCGEKHRQAREDAVLKVTGRFYPIVFYPLFGKPKQFPYCTGCKVLIGKENAD